MSIDDKAIVPVGEPDCPVSTRVRGHNQSLVPLNGSTLLALDHDFHGHEIVPSVAFSLIFLKVLKIVSLLDSLLLQTKTRSLSHHIL